MHFKNYLYKFFKKQERIKWYIAIMTAFIPIIIKYIFPHWKFIFHFFLFIIFFQLSILIAFSTIKGKELLYFIYQSKNEIKKIIWPNQKETFYTTFIVVIATICMSLILWGLDNILFRLVSFITHLRL